MSLPIDLVPEVVVYQSSQRTPAVYASPPKQFNTTPNSLTQPLRATHPHGSFGVFDGSDQEVLCGVL